MCLDFLNFSRQDFRAQKEKLFTLSDNKLSISLEDGVIVSLDSTTTSCLYKFLDKQLKEDKDNPDTPDYSLQDRLNFLKEETDLNCDLFSSLFDEHYIGINENTSKTIKIFIRDDHLIIEYAIERVSYYAKKIVLENSISNKVLLRKIKEVLKYDNLM